MNFTNNLAGIRVGSSEFWRENIYGAWATLAVLLFIFVWRSLLGASARRLSSHPLAPNPPISKPSTSSLRISEIVSNDDLKNLLNALDGKLREEKWEDVVDKRNNLVSYNAKNCKPKDGPLKYLSVTIFENCSIELLRDFYMDNEYRKEWDKMLIEYKQLQIDESNGIEIGHMIKKFPLLTPREYVLAWRVWEGKDKTFYCFMKECEHDQIPRQKKYVRVGYFRSGWRIRKVAGRDACEIAMVHQEDAGLNVEMAKFAFAKGIWSYVCKMDTSMRKYTLRGGGQLSTPQTALSYIQKVPSELETIGSTARRDPSTSSAMEELGEKKVSRKPFKKWIANCLLVGGVVFLSRGHASLVAKIAMACVLKKFSKHGTVSSACVGQTQAS